MMLFCSAFLRAGADPSTVQSRECAALGSARAAYDPVQRRPRDGHYFSLDSFLTPFQGKNVVSDDCPQKPVNER